MKMESNHIQKTPNRIENVDANNGLFCSMGLDKIRDPVTSIRGFSIISF